MPTAKKGERFGGRAKGTPNKATLQKIQETAGAIRERKASGRKLPREVLEELMGVAVGMAARHQPAPGGAPPNPHEDREEFKFYLMAAGNLAKWLAPYYHATFKAIPVMAPPEQLQLGDRPEGKNVIDITDSETVTRVYRRMIAVRG